MKVVAIALRTFYVQRTIRAPRPASLAGVFLIAQWLLLDSIFPRVEDPWPESIGIGFPFTVAGAFGVLANVIFSEAPQQQRERAIRLGGVYGFQFGAVIYVLSLIVQVASSR